MVGPGILPIVSSVEEAHPDIDPRFLFVNVGYNVRPLESSRRNVECPN